MLVLRAAGRSEIKKHGETIDEGFYIVSEIAENGEAFDYVEAAGGLDDLKTR